MCLGVLTLKSACNQGANDRDQKKKQKNGQNIPRNTNREADLKTWQKFFGTENVHLTKTWTWGKGGCNCCQSMPHTGNTN